MTESCNNCRYFKTSAHEGGDGICRRHAPRMTATRGAIRDDHADADCVESYWPKHAANLLCGEWTRHKRRRQRPPYADTTDPSWALDVYQQESILDLILCNDVGLLNDPVLRPANAYHSTCWVSFLVAYRMYEQLFKLVTRDPHPIGSGHLVKTMWDKIDKEYPPDGVPDKLCVG